MFKLLFYFQPAAFSLAIRRISKIDIYLAKKIKIKKSIQVTFEAITKTNLVR